MLYLWYHPWYQAFYVGYQYRIGIEASDYKSISIVSVSKFQVLESISIVSVSNFRTLEVSVSYRYRKKRYRRALSCKRQPIFSKRFCCQYLSALFLFRFVVFQRPPSFFVPPQAFSSGLLVAFPKSLV